VTNENAAKPSAKPASNKWRLWFFGILSIGLWVWAFIAPTQSNGTPWLYRAVLICGAAFATLRFAYAVWRHKRGLPPE